MAQYPHSPCGLYPVGLSRAWAVAQRRWALTSLSSHRLGPGSSPAPLCQLVFSTVTASSPPRAHSRFCPHHVRGKLRYHALSQPAIAIFTMPHTLFIQSTFQVRPSSSTGQENCTTRYSKTRSVLSEALAHCAPSKGGDLGLVSTADQTHLDHLDPYTPHHYPFPRTVGGKTLGSQRKALAEAGVGVVQSSIVQGSAGDATQYKAA